MIILDESIYLLTNSTERGNQLHCRRNAKNQLNWGLMTVYGPAPMSYSQYIFRSFSYLKWQILNDSALWTLHASRLDTYELFERSQLLTSWWLNQPLWKIWSWSKWVHLPHLRDENKKYLQPPPSINSLRFLCFTVHNWVITHFQQNVFPKSPSDWCEEDLSWPGRTRPVKGQQHQSEWRPNTAGWSQPRSGQVVT